MTDTDRFGASEEQEIFKVKKRGWIDFARCLSPGGGE